MKNEYCMDCIDMRDIVLIEEKLYRRYKEVIGKFEKRFSFYHCKIELIECWTTGDSNIATRIRPTLDDEYIYWICYQVVCDENPIVYDDENSPLARSYLSLKIKHRKRKVIVEVFEDIEDVAEELEEDFGRLKLLKETGNKTGDG